MAKKILLALHNPSTLGLFKRVCKSANYELHIVNNREELFKQAKSGDYSRYIMDLNFGNPGSPDITPAVQLYEFVKPKIADGSAKFLGISGSNKTVKLAQESKIPSKDLTDFGLKDMKSFLSE